MNISDEQKAILLKYLPELEQSVDCGDIEDILDQLDDKITEIGFNKDYSLNAVGLKLQRLYDQLYMQNQ